MTVFVWMNGRVCCGGQDGEENDNLAERQVRRGLDDKLAPCRMELRKRTIPSRAYLDQVVVMRGNIGGVKKRG